MPRVSIIVPTYNRAHTITRALDSLLVQTYPDLEIIVVDDGSTDSTRDILAGYDDRVRYHYQQNAGPAAARNTGIRMARGEFIGFLDSDDTVSPTKVALQVALLDARPEIDWVVTGVQMIAEDGETVLEEIVTFNVDEILKEILLTVSRGLFPPHVPLMRRECIERVGLFDETLPAREEQDFWIRVAMAGCKAALIEQALCQFWITAGSRGQNLSNVQRAYPRILDKVFSNPDLPPAVLALKEDLYARAYLEFGLYHLRHSRTEVGSEMDAARAYFIKAHTLRSAILTWRQNHFNDFDVLPYKAIELDPQDPEACLRRLFKSLFAGVSVPDWLLPRLLSRLHVILAFRAHEAGERSQVVAHMLRGAYYYPGAMRDRGTASVFLRSLLRLPVGN